MLASMICAMVIASLLGCAGFLAERAARLVRAPTRSIWLLTLFLSVLMPMAVMSNSIHVPRLQLPSVNEVLFSLSGPFPSTLCAVLPYVWVASTAIALLALITNAVLLLWRARRWKVASLDGTRVLVAPDAGPAAFGWLWPRIVVPNWIEHAPPARQVLVMAHERSHIAAGDCQALAIAFCLLVIMPWNLPLWYQFKRLRQAIEVDCDSRVLKSGHNPVRYGEMLLEMGQRQSSFIGAVAAMSWPKSLLEERIRLMLGSKTRRCASTMVSLGLFALGLVIVALQIRAC